MTERPNLDAHARPPDAIRDLYKRCQKLKDFTNAHEVLDLHRLPMGCENDPKIERVRELDARVIASILQAFDERDEMVESLQSKGCGTYVYGHADMPGTTCAMFYTITLRLALKFLL
jgi:hypothetical protein